MEKTVYHVQAAGGISDSTIQAPRLRSHVYSIACDLLKTSDSILSAVSRCPPLASVFQKEALNLAEKIICEVSATWPRNAEFSTDGLTLVHSLRNENDGWRALIVHEGEAATSRHREQIAQWLAEPIDWKEMEWFDELWDGQEHALQYFQSLAPEILEKLGVVIVEGDCPGSSYYAAELRLPLAMANAIAGSIPLPIFFAKVG